MAKPDLAVYHQLPSGYFNKISDLSGPYAWNGTLMTLVDLEGADTGNATATNQTTQIALLGVKTTAVTALETGGIGIIGWLSQVWRDLVAMSAKLPASLGIKTAAASLSVAPASDATFITNRVGYSSRISVTRQANTPTYSIGDVVGGASGVWEFTNIGPSGGEILITWSTLMKYRNDVPAGMTSFRAHMYNVTPPSALADDAAWDLPSGDRTAYLGYIDIGTPLDVGSTLYVQERQEKQVKLAGTSLFVYFVTNGSYVAGSATVMEIDLHSVAM